MTITPSSSTTYDIDNIWYFYSTRVWGLFCVTPSRRRLLNPNVTSKPLCNVWFMSYFGILNRDVLLVKIILIVETFCIPFIQWVLLMKADCMVFKLSRYFAPQQHSSVRIKGPTVTKLIHTKKKTWL